MLRCTGVTVEFAEDGRRCIDLLNDASEDYYDLILMDIMMPGMNGIEATRQIRRLSDPVKSRIPVIAMSANVQKKDKGRI